MTLLRHGGYTLTSSPIPSGRAIGPCRACAPSDPVTHAHHLLGGLEGLVRVHGLERRVVVVAAGEVVVQIDVEGVVRAHVPLQHQQP